MGPKRVETDRFSEIREVKFGWIVEIYPIQKVYR
jgi:hypothetical protein